MPNNKQLTFIDFFAGIGGFRLGLETAGMKCIGFCEKDKFAVRSYRAMYDTEGEWYGEDITKLKSDDVPKTDIWTAGSPCQNLSIAGRRAGLHGDRSGLFFEFINLLKGKKEEDKPEWVIMENVKGLLSSNAGWDFLEYISKLAEAGYDVQWQLFNSKFYGVAQNRERVYTIGHLRSRGRREVLPIGPESCGNLKQIIDGYQGERVYDPSGISVTLVSGAGGSGAKTGLYLIDQSTSSPKITDEARCITSRYTAGATRRTAMNSAVLEVGKKCSGCPKETLDKRKSNHINENTDGTNYYSEDIISCEIIKELGDALASDHIRKLKHTSEGIKLRNGTKLGYQIAFPGDSVDLSYPSSETRRARVGHGFAHALSCAGNAGVVVWNGKFVRIRRLTPRECFKLQGFTDELFDKANEVNSDAQLYKQAGNGVTVNVVYAIGRKISEMVD
ncbi:DNA cytosine methyltransferase [Clostridium polynesiense]|uniref:DNA cytosine methyltransferase n=1 Tax=Clostridium polynesiense TaxID=1325933 RepID=UPI00058CEBC3|nr:DNA cytosine methyltransferase [Clostridium polynesiense]